MTGRNSDRIALFMQDFAGGGAERMMINLAVGLHNLGEEIELVVVRKTGPLLAEVPSEIPVFDLGSGRVRKSVRPLVRYLRRVRPEALVSTLAPVNIVALVAARWARTGTRVTVREANHVSSNHAGVRFPMVRIAYRLMPWIYRWAHAVVAVSESVATDLQQRTKLPSGRMHVLRNPTVTPRLATLMKQPAEHPWADEDDAPFILSVGRLVEQQDFETLIHAFARLSPSGNERLVILGEGPLRGALEALVAEHKLQSRVLMPGFVDNPFAWMARCAVFCSTSRWEGSPNVLVEAMACGAPVVATDCPGGTDEILEHGKWGHLTPMGDADAIAKAIGRAMADSSSTNRSQKRAHAFHVETASSAYRRVILGQAT